MTAIHETAYPRLKPQLNKKEMAELFAILPEEKQFLDENTRQANDTSRLGFMLLLKCYQCVGYPVSMITLARKL